MGTKLADQANRDGMVERCAAPAVPKSVAGDLALLGSYDQWRNDVELPIVPPAQQHDAHTVYRQPSVPGIGTMLRVVLLDAIHAMRRFPRGQDCVASCRLVTCAKASAGKRSGPSGTQSGKASLAWAFAEAAVRFLRHTPEAQRKKLENPLLGRVCPLTTGGLIRVRQRAHAPRPGCSTRLSPQPTAPPRTRPGPTPLPPKQPGCDGEASASPSARQRLAHTEPLHPGVTKGVGLGRAAAPPSRVVSLPDPPPAYRHPLREAERSR